MISKYIFLLLLAVNIVNINLAQGTDKIRLHSISSVGLVAGSHAPSVALQTIFGAGYKQSFVGVGVGLDYYRYRSIPLFADLRQEFGKGKNKLFFYGDIGYNYDWLNKNNLDPYNYEPPQKFSGGLYYEPGIGYKMEVGKSTAILFSAGYSFKKLQLEVGTGMCPLNRVCYDAIQTYRYYFSRFAFRAGWQF